MAKYVLLSVTILVGAVGVPTNSGPVVTKAVVANCVLDVPAAAVGAVGIPAKCGLLVTKAVVAICVVAVSGAAVGAVGTPENAGDIFCA